MHDAKLIYDHYKRNCLRYTDPLQWQKVTRANSLFIASLYLCNIKGPPAGSYITLRPSA